MSEVDTRWHDVWAGVTKGAPSPTRTYKFELWVGSYYISEEVSERVVTSHPYIHELIFNSLTYKIEKNLEGDLGVVW